MKPAAIPSATDQVRGMSTMTRKAGIASVRSPQRTFGTPWAMRQPTMRRAGAVRGRKGARGSGAATAMTSGEKKRVTRKKATGDLIISKARTKAATKKCNVGGEFYTALDQAVRKMIAEAEGRALGNKRKTLKAVDL